MRTAHASGGAPLWQSVAECDTIEANHETKPFRPPQI